jgi:hypothetical protein
MGERVFEEVDDVLPPDPDGEIVHWMDPKPLSVGPAGISAAAAGALVLGVALTLVVLALTHWLGPERALRRPRWRGRG